MNKSLYIALGYSCNHQCIYCPCHINAKSSPPISANQVINAIKSIADKADIQSITLSGGEPTIQNNFYEVISYLGTTNYKINILSNSETFYDEENVKKMISFTNFKQIHVTTAIHHIDGLIHDSVTGVEGSFVKSLIGLQNLRTNNVDVSVKCIINKINHMVLPDYINFIINNFDENVRLIFCGMDYCGKANSSINKTLLPFEEITPFLEKAIDLYEKSGRQKISIDELPLCLVDPYYWRYYNHNSNKSISGHISPMHMDNKVKVVENMTSDCGQFYEKCKECDVRHLCVGTWRSVYELLGENAVNTIKCIQ